MMKTLINIFPFDGEPFSNQISLWIFKAKENLKWNEIGWIIKQIRVRIRNSTFLVFQHGRNMISTRNLSNRTELKDLTGYFEVSSCKTLNVEEDEELEILRRLLGEAISHQLRNDMRHAYKVIEQPGAVYYASDPTEITGFGELDVYKGFVFVPLIQKSGRAGVMVDPRAKYHTKRNLRDLLMPNDYESWIKELEFNHIDICPISWCEEKNDPLSPCKLSGSGDSITIIDFFNDPPEKTGGLEDEEKSMNLIEYHDKKSVCPRGYLKNFLDKYNPPVAISDFGYPYPLERIRRSPRTNLLENLNDRKLLHRIISLDSHRRYSKTLGYAKLFQNLEIDDIFSLRSRGDFLSIDNRESFSLRSGKILGTELLISQDKPTYYPNVDVMKFGPYKQPEGLQTLNVVTIIIGKHDKIDEFIHLSEAIILGESKIDLINETSLHSLLKAEIQIIKTLQITERNEKSLESLFAEIRNLALRYRNRLLFFLAIGEKSQGLTAQIKKFLVENDLPNQGFVMPTFLERFESEQRSYFFNIFLGAFCKLGGVPWVVESSNKSLIYVGYNRIIRDDKIIYSLALYDSLGIWVEGSVTFVDKKSFESQFESDLKQLVNDRKEEKIRFYSIGALYEISEYDIIRTKLKATKKEFSILEIVHNPVRLYTVSDRGSFSARRGSYVEFLPNQVALVTTIPPGRQGTPQPILIRLKHGDSSLIPTYLEEIFKQTYYVGYGRMIIRYPSPIHAVRQILQNVKILNLDSNIHFKTPWFI